MAIALAIESLCFWPPETLVPPCEISVSYFSGLDSINSVAWAILAALFISPSVASFLPYLKFESIVPENNIPFWGTYPIFSLKSCCVTSFMFTPSTNISPLVTSKNLGIKLINVDFPLPVLPINAVVSPALAVNEISVNISSSASGYLNETFLNSITPFLSFLNLTGFYRKYW